MIINSRKPILLTASLDDDIMCSLKVYHQLLEAVEEYNISNLKRLEAYIAGLTLYDDFVNDSVDCENAPSRIYKSDTIIQYRLINYIEARRKRNDERNKHKCVVPITLPPLPIPQIKEVTYLSLKKFVNHNSGRCGDIDNIADFEELFAQQDMILQYQLHSDILLLAEIYSYIENEKRGVTYVDVE